MSQPQDNYSNFTPGPAPGGPGMPPQMGRGGPPPPGFRPGMPSPPFPASPGPMMPPPGQRQTPPPGIPPMMNQQQPLFRQGPPPQMSQQQWQPQPTQPFMGSPQAQAQGQPPHRVSPLPDQRASPQPQTITQQNQPQSQHMPPPTHQIPPQRMMPPPGPPQGQQTPGGMPPPMRQPPVPGQPGAIPPPGAPAQTPPTPAQPFSRYPPPGPAGFGQQPPMASPPNIPPPMSQPGQVPPPAHTMRPDGSPAQPPPPPLSSQQRQGVPPPASSGYPYPPIHNLSLNDNLQQSLPPHIPPPSVPAPQALAFGDAAGQGGFQAPSIMGGQQRPMIPAPVSQQPQDMKMQQPQAPAQHQHQQHQQQQPQSAANRIDVRQIPTPVKMKKYPDMYKKVIYRTVTQGLIPPPANSRYKVVDEGSCDPRFIRATLHCAPKSDDILKNSNLVFGAILQPLAEITPDSSSYGTENEVVGGGKQVVSYAGRRNPIPVVNFGEEEPIRCNRCKAYINPFVTFIDAGVKYICNFCGFTNEVPHDYVCNLDGYGRRRDIDRRPELKFGSVEIVATQKYYTNNTLPAPLTYVFLIDVSQNAINQGILTTFISSLKPILNDLAAINPKSKVAFITYARNIHFYSVKKDGSAPNMLVVGDVDNVFVPIPESALLSFSDVDAIDGFLSKLEGLVAGLQEVDCCLGSALSAAYQLLSETGGKVLAFCSNLPNRGKGAIKTREDMKLYGTPKEKVLFSPQEGFWKVFADECAKAQISVDTFLFPSTFNEAATLGHISKKTCGQLYLYNSFNVNRDAERFQFELQRNLRRETGYNGILRVRCSRGFTIKRYYGHYYESNEGDMDLAGIDCDKSFGVEFKFDGKFEDEFAYIQSALLYTTSDGHRLIRIHTLKMDVGNTVGKVFRGADVDAYMAMQSRWAIDKVIHGGSNDTIAAVRDQLTEKCIDLLTSYKKHCATAPSPGQLILPESLKFTPVYILALSKTTALRQGTDIPLDERISAMYALMTLPVDQVLAFIYPRLYALHNMPPPLLNDDGTIDCSLPPPLNPSSENIQHDGVYLLDDTVHTFFWVGREADPEIVQQLFNVPSVDELSPLFARLQPADTDLGRRVSAILQELRQYRSTYGRLRVFRERDPGESQFFARLVEDKSQSAMSYVEYLCHLHREIQLKLS